MRLSGTPLPFRQMLRPLSVVASVASVATGATTDSGCCICCICCNDQTDATGTTTDSGCCICCICCNDHCQSSHLPPFRLQKIMSRSSSMSSKELRSSNVSIKTAPPPTHTHTQTLHVSMRFVLVCCRLVYLFTAESIVFCVCVCFLRRCLVPENQEGCCCCCRID